MKVQVYSKFSKNKFWKNEISNLHEQWTFNTSKCRGKLQKMGVLYTDSPKSPGPFPKLPQKNKKLNKKISTKMGTA
jgi:hypothetical protein